MSKTVQCPRCEDESQANAVGHRMKHIIFYSGGAASWAAAKRVAEAHGTDDLVLLFTDTMMEDADTYRFLRESAANVGGELVEISDGRDPWEVFFDSRFLGNSRVDPCSRILKREKAATWIKDNCDPETTTLYLGISWDEIHRCEAISRNWQPYRVEFPLCNEPYLTKHDIHDMAEAEGIDRQRLYRMGFPHANCGGFCIKAGQGHFKILLDTMPKRFAYHESREQELREHLGRDDIAILRDRAGGDTTPLTLREFRERIEAGGQCDLFDLGGCGCFTDSEGVED